MFLSASPSTSHWFILKSLRKNKAMNKSATILILLSSKFSPLSHSTKSSDQKARIDSMIAKCTIARKTFKKPRILWTKSRREGKKLNLTTEKKVSNILRTRSSQPMSNISTQNLSLSRVSNTFNLLGKYGLVESASSANKPRKSVKMSCNNIRNS